MSRPLSFTPAGRSLAEVDSRPVKRRLVLFVPGYDPESESRYRRLFVREFIRYAKTFELRRRSVSPVEALPGLPSKAWTVRAGGEDWETETRYEILLWDDIVRRDFRRTLPIVMSVFLCGLLASLVTGTMMRFWRSHWKFGGVILYPAFAVAALLGVSLGVGWAVHHILSTDLVSSQFVRLVAAVGAALLAFLCLRPLGKRWFVWHLMHDWVFNFQNGMGWRKDYDERVGLFASHLAARLGDEENDEVLVVGHSSGSSMAVDVVAIALERLREGGGAPSRRLALLTVGSCIPLVAFNPLASGFRKRMRRLMTDASVLWVEYQAPQDWINFASFNPQTDLSLEVSDKEQVNPIIRSARFREIVSEEIYSSIVFRPFRMHFQFLNANDRPGEYDYIMMVAGPVAMSTRLALALGEKAAEPTGARGVPFEAAGHEQAGEYEGPAQRGTL